MSGPKTESLADYLFRVAKQGLESWLDTNLAELDSKISAEEAILNELRDSRAELDQYQQKLGSGAIYLASFLEKGYPQPGAAVYVEGYGIGEVTDDWGDLGGAHWEVKLIKGGIINVGERQRPYSLVEKT